MRPCFMFSNVGPASQPARLEIFHEIGLNGVQTKDFLSRLHAVKDSGQIGLTVEISSPGGSVDDALAMYNGLRHSGLAITTKVLGAAMSAASLVFMAGDTRVMPRNSWLMLHNPSTAVFGNADDMSEAAETLRKLGDLVRGTYCARSGVSDAGMRDILAQDTFFTADEAKDLGFATAIAPEVRALARFDMARAQMPPRVLAAYGGPSAMAEGAALWRAFRAARA